MRRHAGSGELVDSSSWQRDDYLLSWWWYSLSRGVSWWTLGGTYWLLLQHQLTTRFHVMHLNVLCSAYVAFLISWYPCAITNLFHFVNHHSFIHSFHFFGINFLIQFVIYESNLGQPLFWFTHSLAHVSLQSSFSPLSLILWYYDVILSLLLE